MKLMKNKGLPEHWDTLELPVWNWWQIHEKNDLSFLLKVQRKITTKENEKLTEVWEKIYDEFIKEFGFSNNFQAIINKRIYIYGKRKKLIETGDRTLLVFINKAKDELEALIKKTAGMKDNFMKTKIAIDRANKFQLDLHKTSTREFYSHLQFLKKQ